jgi:hypothetical protein
MDCYNVFLHDFFYDFFFKDLCRFYFFHIELVENFASWLKKKQCGLLQCFATWFLFCYSISPYVFFKIIFVEFFFNIKLVGNLTLTFPTCFFFLFFCFFFQNFLLLFFYFFILCFFSELFLSILFF